jgi:2-haloalkanoic acid dehalogenase type II
LDDVAGLVGVHLPAGQAYLDWRRYSDREVRLGGRSSFPFDGATPAFRAFRETWVTRFEELFRYWGVDVRGEVGADAYVDWHAGAVTYPDVLPALTALRGRYRLGVLSDADRDFLHASVRRSKLRFDAIIASEDLRAYKPHVSMFQKICGPLEVDPEVAVYVGDRPWDDIDGARNAGMMAIWINRHEAVWPEDLEPPLAVVTSLDELVKLLQAWAGRSQPGVNRE